MVRGRGRWGGGRGGEDYVFTPPTGSYHIHLFQGLFADEKKVKLFFRSQEWKLTKEKEKEQFF